jgi:threonine dehydrogenase-like Zn-dependent dehydrogenase
MLRLLVDGRRGPRLEEVETPPCLAGQVLIRTVCSLVSPGTERHYVSRCRETDEQLRLGYCVAGVVEQVGEGVTSVAPGERVIGMGWSYACHAECVAVPQRLVCKVPDFCELDDAVFANLLATAVHAVDRASLTTGDRVLVVGAGLVGSLVAEVCSNITRDVMLTDQHAREVPGRKHPFELASAMTAHPEPWAERFTKAFVCISGEATAWMKVLPGMLSARGNEQHRPRVIGVGRYTAQMTFSVEMGNLDVVFAARCGEGYRNERYVHGDLALAPLPGEASVDANLRRSLELIANERIHVRHLVGRRIGLAELPAFYELAYSPERGLSAIVRY